MPSDVSTFCRVCEPMCGVFATVEEGRITKIRSNPDHVLSRGHFCKKAAGMIDVTYDVDRVRTPLKRTGGPGEFTPVSWNEALDDITGRLTALREREGAEAFATYIGNPPYFSYATVLGIDVFKAALGVRWHYGVAGEDSGALAAACEILYGSGGLIPKPDLWRTKFLLIAGANPVTSHGSSFVEPQVSQALRSIGARGGRVVVLDPRYTETARRGTHVPLLAGSDAYVLAALLRELIVQGFVSHRFIARHTRGFDVLRQAVEPCTTEWAEHHSGVPAQLLRTLARDIGTAESFAVHGRTGTSTQRYGTLATMLLHLLPIVTGHFDVPGGISFGWAPTDPSAGLKDRGYGKHSSRVDRLPDTAGLLPSLALINDIDIAGAGQVRALMMVGGNPSLTSTGSGPKLDAALQKLDLFFSLDLYVNETNRYAHYVLPVTGMFEREDVPLLTFNTMLRPSLFATAPVIDRVGEAREEWEVFYEIGRRMGYGEAFSMTPRDIVDQVIRQSSVGDRFGENPAGVCFQKLLDEHPNGYGVFSELPTGVLEAMIATPDKRINLASDELLSELKRLHHDRSADNHDYPLRLIGLRETLSHNTWMHNAGSLMPRSR
ncbi:MAG: molybdopterin-dependent oxidoreductase, partial [Steroidobacteraceae bacterium]